jgi:hypothetical protein
MGACACHDRVVETEGETDGDLKTELLRRYLKFSRQKVAALKPLTPELSSSEDSASDEFIAFEPSPAKSIKSKTIGAYKQFRRPRVKLEAHSEEVYGKINAPQGQQAYSPPEPIEESFEMIMELRKSRPHYLRSPAPRLSQEQYAMNLIGILTDEDERRSSPVRRSVTYSPVIAIE